MWSSIVSTPLGKISGESRGGLQVFRGIPYARAPRGPLRWRAPRPPEPWSGVLNANNWGPSAPQSPAMMMLLRRLIGVGLSEQSQDCLYLNVYTPRPDGKRRPVLVWIHGGAFILGSGSTRIYDGSWMARTGDAVVVTINYRLGALGFLNTREIFPGHGDTNLGIRDQIAALEWVRDNIDAFGGDPENVTIFGESAGGMSVGTLLGTPAAHGLFHRAVAQSGAAHNVSTQLHASRVAEIFLEELGARGPDALDTASVSEIVDAQQRTIIRAGIATGNLPWQPSLDRDLIPAQPLISIACGRGAKVPLIIGTNRDEWNLFMLGDRRSRRLDEDGLRKQLRRLVPEGDGEMVERAIRTYQGGSGGRGHETASDILAAFQSDRIFHHPAHALAHFHSRHVPETRAYLFDWTPPLVKNAVGACHGAEIPFVFGSYREPVLRLLVGFGREVERLSRRMMTAWVAFARTGDPNHSRLAPWPTYDAEDRSTLTLGRSPRVQRQLFSDALEFWTEIDPLVREAEVRGKRRSRGLARDASPRLRVIPQAEA